MSNLSELIGSSVDIAKGTINGVSRNILNAVYPSEFEVYFISLELIDSDGNIEEYFTFPINPNFISKTEPTTKSIKRTFDKIIVDKSDKFTPQDLILKGNFGRDFKIVIRQKGEIVFNSILSQTKMFTPEEFSSTIKSGYGSMKILQGICKRSNEKKNGKPKRLYLHNYILGESYLVEVTDLSLDQSLQSNMMWNYTLRLKIISPVELGLVDKIDRSQAALVQQMFNKSLNSVRNFVTQVL